MKASELNMVNLCMERERVGENGRRVNSERKVENNLGESKVVEGKPQKLMQNFQMRIQSERDMWKSVGFKGLE